MGPTLKDIADRAGVSISTVSRIINNDPNKRASATTTKKVWKIIHEMNYKPNEAARMLIRGVRNKDESPRNAIGCILSASNDVFADPFFAEVIAGIHAEVAQKGYVMEYTFPISSTNAIQNSAFFNNLVARNVDGAILLGRFSQELYDMLKNNIPRIVYCGLNYIDDDISQVICDATRGIELAVSYLIDLGHKRIGFIGETNRDHKLLNERRFHTFSKTIRSYGFNIKEKDIIEAQLVLGGGYQAVINQLDPHDHASAYVCANDITAIGAMCAIQKKGINIPKDISLIGFDDIEMCQYVSPSLTTIHVDIKNMGFLSAHKLIDSIENEIPSAISSLPFELKQRESCSVYS